MIQLIIENAIASMPPPKEPYTMPQRENLPHTTVATIVEKAGKYLLVEEHQNGKAVYNQPAGHLEQGENLLQAAIRETLEETCWEVELTHYIGISHLLASNGIHYLRHTFLANAIKQDVKQVRDPDILNTHWMSYDEFISCEEQLRSPMVLNDIERHRAGQRYSLDILGPLIDVREHE